MININNLNLVIYMIDKDKELLNYWNRENVESMYDKHLLAAEINLIKRHIKSESKILDVGCGEGEGTLAYSQIEKVLIHAADFSETRLRMAKKRLKNCRNVLLKKVDFLKNHSLDEDYDYIISQRFLINIVDWSQQKKVLKGLMSLLKVKGSIILLEGSKQGAKELNDFRKLLKMDPVTIKWHNLFLDDVKLINYMQSNHFKLINQDGLGEYFLLTRGIRPYFDKKLSWNSQFNQLSSSRQINRLLNLGQKFSRLKLWIFQKEM